MRVSVATVWRSPAAPRPVDRPALADPADVRGWLAGMTLADRRGLQGRADTQVLLGDRVLVVAREPGWAEVRVPDQPTPLSAAGYPGWVPAAQLTPTGPAVAARQATVVRPTAWLYRAGSAARLVEASFGTRLPVKAVGADWVDVALPDREAARVRTSDVAVTATGAAALPASGADVVRTAGLFLGLPYLWAGTSGFGLDCSGLTYLVYRAHGVTLPRDADPQARAGRPVGPGPLAAGVLVFFASPGGPVHHAGIATGAGSMIDSPQTGAAVEQVPVGAFSLARRYLP